MCANGRHLRNTVRLGECFHDRLLFRRLEGIRAPLITRVRLTFVPQNSITGVTYLERLQRREVLDGAFIVFGVLIMKRRQVEEDLRQ